MGQDSEFTVRQVRGKGIQIIPLSGRSSRFYWVSIGITLGLTASNLAYRFTQSISGGVSISATLLLVNMLGQIIHLVIIHRRYKAMLKEVGVTEKQMFAVVDAIIKEGEANLEKMKQEAIEKFDEMQRKEKAKWWPKDAPPPEE